jgi:hypothetical protein
MIHLAGGWHPDRQGHDVPKESARSRVRAYSTGSGLRGDLDCETTRSLRIASFIHNEEFVTP